jgi:hypothetical protein
VDVWTRLRRFVNDDEDLAPWRLAVLRLIDPIEWYMRTNDNPPWGRHPMRMASGSATYGEMRADDRPVIDPPRVSPIRENDEAFDRRREALLAELGPYFETVARDCLAGREAHLVTTAGTITVRLLRFRNGAVLEDKTVAPDSRGYGLMRIERGALGVRVIAQQLLQLVSQLGPAAKLHTE